MNSLLHKIKGLALHIKDLGEYLPVLENLTVINKAILEGIRVYTIEAQDMQDFEDLGIILSHLYGKDLLDIPRRSYRIVKHIRNPWIDQERDLPYMDRYCWTVLWASETGLAMEIALISCNTERRSPFLFIQDRPGPHLETSHAYPLALDIEDPAIPDSIALHWETTDLDALLEFIQKHKQAILRHWDHKTDTKELLNEMGLL